MKNMSTLSLPEVPQNGETGMNSRPASPIPPPSSVRVFGTAAPRCRSRSQSRPPSVLQQR